MLLRTGEYDRGRNNLSHEGHNLHIRELFPDFTSRIPYIMAANMRQTVVYSLIRQRGILWHDFCVLLSKYILTLTDSAEDAMLELGKWVLASVAWLAGILIIALIDTFKDLKYKHRLGEDVVLKSRR